MNTIDTIKGKQILIISFTGSTPHLETSLEITQRLSENNNVKYIHLGQYVSRPTLFPSNIFKRKIQLKIRVNRAKEYIQKFIEKEHHKIWINPHAYGNLVMGQLDHLRKEISSMNVNNINELKKISYKGYCIGFGLVNNLISDLRNSDPFPLSEIVLKELREQYLSAMKSIILTNKLLGSEKTYDAIVLLNGRFSCENACKQVAKSKNIKTYFHECGPPYQMNRFFFEEYMPQNFDKRKEEMEKLKILLPKNKIEEIGKNFFRRKTNGDGVYEKSYVKNQSKNISKNLSNFIKNSKKNGAGVISFFTSSDDEFNAIEDDHDRFPVWINQIEAIKKIAYISNECNFSFVVRVHPNLENKSYSEQMRWQDLNQFVSKIKCYWIDSNSKESTYSLIQNSDIIITAGSSVGIEAVYLKKISFAIAKCYYDGIIPSIKRIPSPSILKEKLLSFETIPKPIQSDTYIYGAWAMSYGTKFKYFNHKPFGFGLMNGKYRIASAGMIQRSISKIKKFSQNKLHWIK